MVALLTWWLIVATSAALILWVVYKADRRWHERHPGAEEKFTDIDEELTRKGR